MQQKCNILPGSVYQWIRNTSLSHFELLGLLEAKITSNIKIQAYIFQVVNFVVVVVVYWLVVVVVLVNVEVVAQTCKILQTQRKRFV